MTQADLMNIISLTIEETCIHYLGGTIRNLCGCLHDQLASTIQIDYSNHQCQMCFCAIGPDPVRAMTDIHRLQLMPAVFTTPDADAKLPGSWGGPCVRLIAAAKSTLADIKFQVHHLSPCNTTRHMVFFPTL